MAFFQWARRPKSARRSRFFLPSTWAVLTEATFFLKRVSIGLLDLDLVGRRGDAEDVLVELLGEKAGLLRHEDALDDVVGFFHGRD